MRSFTAESRHWKANWRLSPRNPLLQARVPQSLLRTVRRTDDYVRFGWRVQPVDATPSNLARGGGVRWRGLHGYGSRRSRGLRFGRAGRTVNVWRISLGRLRGGTRTGSIVSGPRVADGRYVKTVPL